MVVKVNSNKCVTTHMFNNGSSCSDCSHGLSCKVLVRDTHMDAAAAHMSARTGAHARRLLQLPTWIQVIQFQPTTAPSFTMENSFQMEIKMLTTVVIL